MSSQAGNIHDLAAYAGHPSSFIIGSEAEPDSLSTQEFPPNTHTPLPSDMGLRFMTLPVSDDAHFSPEQGTSQSTVYSNDTNNPNQPSSTIPFSSFPTAFHSELSGPLNYTHSASSLFSSNTPNFYMPDIKPATPRYHGSDTRSITGFPTSPEAKPFLGPYSLSPTMAPPTRSPNMPHLNNPATTRELYTSATPQLRRASDILSRSPSASSNMRNQPISPSSSSGFASPANMENSNAGPPLHATEHLIPLQTSDGQNIRVEILGKVDKGFFMADNDWTCYRRNYFQLSCSYTLHPLLPLSGVHLIHNGQPHQVHALAASIAAVVDGRDGRAIDLVQHTPKRDKGPQIRPDRVTLAARPHPSVQAYGSAAGDGSLGPGGRLYDQGYGQNPGQPPTEHTYERIQFKCATANNGRRRAAQQYYHLVVELCADIGAQMGENRWVKIAQRVSAPVVVRGRSPGHYHSERRHSNASAGGSAGPNGGGEYAPNNGMSRGPPNQLSVSGATMIQNSGYPENYESRAHHYARTNIEVPMDPIMSADEIRAIDESEGYLYYPSPIYEGTGISLPHVRPHLSSLGHRDDRNHGAGFQLPNPGAKIKQEPGGYGGGYSLPSLTAGPPADSLGRLFGRFEGLPSSRGYYPTVFTGSEMTL